jgi:hypothetical protein
MTVYKKYYSKLIQFDFTIRLLGWASPETGLCVNSEIILTQESRKKTKKLGLSKISNYHLLIATKPLSTATNCLPTSDDW